MKLNYIKDEEINLYSDDLLGSKPYADTLIEIIKSSNTPFTIGLFGGWGIGKSSIIKTIIDKFNNDENSKIEVFKYNAWKYSEDSFRRTFIYELKKHFDLDSSENYNSFYEDKHEDIGHKIVIKKYSLLWWIMFMPLLLLIIWFFPTDNDLKLVTTFISLALTIITNLLKETFTQYKITISKPRVFAPEQFEDIFKEAILEITQKENKSKIWFKGLFSKKRKTLEKIVIVIDNIDRCHLELAFELLVTIKNFLEQKDVIFIIPIAETEVKNHIDKQGLNSNEFLRKLFNTTISIKKISEGDLFEFATNLNKKYNLKLSVDILSIVSHEFSKNPRKIIQFLNVLQTEILLARNQEKENIIPKNSITDNLPFYAKILIIREEWNNIYQLLKEKPILISNFYEDINNKKYEDIEISSEQISFFRRTAHIIPNHTNYELFFINRDSFEGIPDDISKLIQSRDSENILKAIEDNVITLDKLIETIDSRFEKGRKRGEINTSVINILTLLFQLSIKTEFKERMTPYLNGNSKFLGGIKSYFNSDSIGNIILNFDEYILIQFIKENKSLTKGLLKSTTRIINTQEKSNQLIKQFIVTFKDEPKEYIDISRGFERAISEDINFIESIKTIVLNNKTIKYLIRENLIKRYIGEISNDINNNDNLLKIKLVSLYSTEIVLELSQQKEIVNKVIGFINSTNDFVIVPFWLRELEGSIKNLASNHLSTIINTVLTKGNWLSSSYNGSYQNEEYFKTLKVYLSISKALYLNTKKDNEKSALISQIVQFFQRNEIPELIKFTNKLFQEIIKSLDCCTWPFSQNIITRFSQFTDWELQKEIADTFNLMLSKTNEKNGLDDIKILKIFELYFDKIIHNKSEIVNWFTIILDNKYLIPFFKTGLSQMAMEIQIETLTILRDLKEDEMIVDIVAEIITKTECNTLEIFLDKLDNNGIPKVMIQKSIKFVLSNIDIQNENYKCYLEFLSTSKFSDQIIHNTISGKVKNMLASANLDDILFSLKIIDKITITDKRKLKVIKTLIQDIEKEIFNNDDLILFNRVKKKLS